MESFLVSSAVAALIMWLDAYYPASYEYHQANISYSANLMLDKRMRKRAFDKSKNIYQRALCMWGTKRKKQNAFEKRKTKMIKGKLLVMAS